MWWFSSGHGHGSNRKKKHCNWWWCAACGGHFEWRAPNRILGVKVKGGWTPFQAFLATVGRLVSQLSLCAGGKRELSIAWLVSLRSVCHRRSSTG